MELCQLVLHQIEQHARVALYWRVQRLLIAACIPKTCNSFLSPILAYPSMTWFLKVVKEQAVFMCAEVDVLAGSS